MKNKVAIIYFSGTGNTEAMAEAVAVGAKQSGADVLLAPVADVDPVEIGNTYHRIILGCSAMPLCSSRKTRKVPSLSPLNKASIFHKTVSFPFLQ